jgi:hypothetical protein
VIISGSFSPIFTPVVGVAHISYILPVRRKYPEQGVLLKAPNASAFQGSSAQAPREGARTPNVGRFSEGAPLWTIQGVNHTISDSYI